MDLTINKQHLHAEILQILDDELALLLKAAEAAYHGAVHDEAVSKSKYETHGLELSYLAGSHFERSVILRRKIQDFRAQSIRDFQEDECITVGALVTLQEGERYEYVYLCQVGAGLLIHLEGKAIQIATPLSPLGVQLIDSYVGDQIEMPAKGKMKNKIIVGLS